MVSGGTCHVPSSLKYLVDPAVVDGAETRPALAPVPHLTKLEYVGNVIVLVEAAVMRPLASTVK